MVAALSGTVLANLGVLRASKFNKLNETLAIINATMN
jgi:hypothetical protein